MISSRALTRGPTAARVSRSIRPMRSPLSAAASSDGGPPDASFSMRDSSAGSAAMTEVRFLYRMKAMSRLNQPGCSWSPKKMSTRGRSFFSRRGP